MPIFSKEGEFHDMAYVWPHRRGWFVMPSSYSTAAGELLELATSGQGGNDLLVYPIAFLYRHAIELSLKEVIHYARRLEDDGLGVPHGHELDKLWERTSALLQKIAPDRSEPGREEVGRIIAELHELDEKSMAFRYDDQEIGKRLEGPVNLRALGETMQRVVSWLEGGVAMLDALIEARAELDRP